MDSRNVIILAILLNDLYIYDAKLIVIPRDTEVKINDSTYMNCSTTLQADNVQWRHGNNYVYTGIAILEPYNDGRFMVEINASTGACNLVIRSVQPSDAGKYECVEDEGFGEARSAQLIVLDDGPVCKSNMDPGGVIGPNSCGIKPDEIQLSSSTTFHGNIPPILQWKASGNNQLIKGLYKVTSNKNEVIYTLTMNSSLDLNNISLICETTRKPNIQYRCYSDIVKIIYVFNGKVTVNMTMNDEVSCFANTSQSCSYKWKWFSGDDITTESDNQTLKPKKVGRHRCEATCSIGNQSCTVQAMYAEVFSTTTTSTGGQSLTLLWGLLLISAATAAAVAVTVAPAIISKVTRRMRQKKDKYTRRPSRSEESELTEEL